MSETQFWKRWIRAKEEERWVLARKLAERIYDLCMDSDRERSIRCLTNLVKAYLEDFEEALASR